MWELIGGWRRLKNCVMEIPEEYSFEWALDTLDSCTNCKCCPLVNTFFVLTRHETFGNIKKLYILTFI